MMEGGHIGFEHVRLSPQAWVQRKDHLANIDADGKKIKRLEQVSIREQRCTDMAHLRVPVNGTN